MIGRRGGDRRVSSQSYATLFEQLDDGFCVIEMLFDAADKPIDYRFLEINPAFERQTGLANALGRTMRELAPAHEDYWFEIYGQIALTGEPARFEYEAVALGRWYDVHAFRTGEPAALRVAILFRDISRRKRAEAALRESEARFRAFVTASADVVYRMSPDWSEMRQLDGRGFIIETAKTRLEWMQNYIHPDDQEMVRAAIASAIAARAVFDLEHRVIRVDGTLGWTSSRAVPLLDERGEITEWLGAAKDVTARREADDARRAGEEQRAFLLELSDALRPLGDPLEVQTLALRMLGEHLAVNRVFAEVLHPDDRERVIAEWRAAVAERRPYAYEMRARASDGRYRWFQARGRPVLDDEGGVTSWVNAAIDVTERHEAEDARRAIEDLFRSFAEYSADTIYILDPGATRLLYVNPAFETMFGEPRDRIMADLGRWMELIHPDDRAGAAARVGDKLASGGPLIHEYRVIRADGDVRWIRDTAFPIHDLAGGRRAIGGICQDVTDKNRMTEALAASERRLTTLVDGIPQLVWRSTERGGWTWASRQWMAFTGQTQEESLERGWLAAVYPDDRARARQAWARARRRGAMSVEYRVRRAADGAWLWHASRAVAVRDHAGHVVEWLGATTDIQTIKELHARQEVMVAELQHRTRNLIGVVRSLFDKTLLAEPAIEPLAATFRDRLAALARVQGLLSALGDGERVAFDTLLAAELGAMGAMGERVLLEGPAGVRLRSSTVQTLALALHELATNAVKYGALGQPGARLMVRWALVAGRRLRVEWRETGVEIPAQGEARLGFGRELIERALPYQLDAITSFELTRDGVHCTIELPVEGDGRVGSIE